IGGIQSLIDGIKGVLEKGPASVSPLLLPMMLPDSPAGKIAIELGLRGPNMAISTACATGNNSIGEAFEIVRRGAATMMIAGSTEAGMVQLAVASLSNMQALSRRNDDPKGASRPFSKDRDGFLIAEGAAALVLEELEHAKARGATIYAEVTGYGSTCDAYHITAPMENGEGAQAAMRRALQSAGLQPEDISYINAHGTSTPLNDVSETIAIKGVFGEHAYKIPISSTKSVTGHLMGSAGSVEAVFSIAAICNQFVPPTINLHTPDPECDLNYVPNVGVPAEIKHVMSNSFGFGGHNAVLIFSHYNASMPVDRPRIRPVRKSRGASASRPRTLRYAHIVGWGMEVPSQVLSNSDLEAIVDTNDEWITSRTGIKERRIAEPRETTTSLATRAAQKALDVADLLPSDIDLIIVATATPEYIFPSTASMVQDYLGATNAGAFDLSAACSGFVYALDMAASKI